MKNKFPKRSIDDDTKFYLTKFIQNGNKELLGKIYQKYKQRLFFHCLRIIRNQEEAQDMTSDAFIKAFENIHTFNLDKPFYPWICRIATNVCIDHIRRKKRVVCQTLNEEKDLVKTETTASAMEQKETADRIKKIIHTLRNPQKRCFCLFYLHQKSYKEISDITGFSFNKVRSHIQNGRRKFKLAIKHLNSP